MEIKIERTPQKLYYLKKVTWIKLEIRYWITATIFWGFGIFIALMKVSTDHGPYERTIPSIIIGSIFIGYGFSFVKAVFDLKKFRDVKFKRLNDQKNIYTLNLNDEKIILEGPKFKQEYDWKYFLKYKVDKTYIYLTDQKNFFFPPIVIDKNEITENEFNQLIEFLQNQKTLFNK